jgi:hypothetical protein
VAQDLWTALCQYVGGDGYDMPTENTEEARALRHKALLDIYRQCGQTSALCEALLDHDQSFCLWRQRHALTVARQIGDVPGTGGTSGLAYLEARSSRRFFPNCGPSVPSWAAPGRARDPGRGRALWPRWMPSSAVVVITLARPARHAVRRCKEILYGDRLGVNRVHHRSVSRRPTPR